LKGCYELFQGQYTNRGKGDGEEGENRVGIKLNRIIMHTPLREVRPAKMIGKYHGR